MVITVIYHSEGLPLPTTEKAEAATAWGRRDDRGEHPPTTPASVPNAFPKHRVGLKLRNYLCSGHLTDETRMSNTGVLPETFGFSAT